MSGPSGAGKGSLRHELTRRHPDIYYGVSATTREKRPGEIDGVSYYFLTREQFQQRIETGQFVEWAEVYGNYYGTPRQPMEDYLASGRTVIIEKDIQGALTLKKIYSDAVFVFIVPPSFEELRRRIVARGTESEQALRQRLASASEELSYIDAYDYVIVNDDVKTAVDQLEAILIAERARVHRQPRLTSKFKQSSEQSHSTEGELVNNANATKH